jgi:guanosine-3',5'-bis(diphosphate) 3'-pyrophosphohydrolase
MNRTEQIWEFVAGVHEGQLYDGKPYPEGHLRGVQQVLADAGLTSESDEIIAASHDSIEDAKDDKHRDYVFTWLKGNLVPFEFGVVWALTGIGENRKARNADAYGKIAANPESANYKVADRIFNWETAVRTGNRLANMYAKEDASFYEHVVMLATNPHLVERYHRLSGRA